MAMQARGSPDKPIAARLIQVSGLGFGLEVSRQGLQCQAINYKHHRTEQAQAKQGREGSPEEGEGNHHGGPQCQEQDREGAKPGHNQAGEERQEGEKGKGRAGHGRLWEGNGGGGGGAWPFGRC